jgi:hypothetical protein
LGEGTVSTGISVSREAQQAFMNSVITPWLDYFLKEEDNAYDNFITAATASGLVLNEQCDGLGWQSFTESQIDVYPNPSNENIQVHLVSNALFDLKIVDASGRVIMTFKDVLLNDFVIDIQSLDAGVYQLVLTNAAAEKIVKRFVKQ